MMPPFDDHVMYHECHITLDPAYEAMANQLAPHFGFKTSKIVGDEVLGDKVWLYCTKSSPNRRDLYIDMVALSTALESANAPWIRRKIEAILIDERRTVQ